MRFPLASLPGAGIASLGALHRGCLLSSFIKQHWNIHGWELSMGDSSGEMANALCVFTAWLLQGP